MLDFFKKEKPFQGLSGFGGGATSLSQHTASGGGGGAISATGGTKVTSPTIIQHFFTSPGTFSISSGSGDVEYLILAGGGSGGGIGDRGNTPSAVWPVGSPVTASGGGGAGGLLSSFPEGPGGPSPTSAAAQPMTPGPYAVTVGSGGVGGPTSPGNNLSQPGNPSAVVFSPTVTLTATGGAEGGIWNDPQGGEDGGSGGGGGYSESPDNMPGGEGTAGQGYDGGYGIQAASGGGGGAGGAGENASNPPANAGDGGIGMGYANIPTDYGTPGPSPTLRYFAGGGGGGSESTNGGAGGYGGGGTGSTRSNTPSGSTNATANTGGGGGGGSDSPGPTSITSGGSGIVIIRYPAS